MSKLRDLLTTWFHKDCLHGGDTLGDLAERGLNAYGPEDLDALTKEITTLLETYPSDEALGVALTAAGLGASLDEEDLSPRSFLALVAGRIAHKRA